MSPDRPLHAGPVRRLVTGRGGLKAGLLVVVLGVVGAASIAVVEPPDSYVLGPVERRTIVSEINATGRVEPTSTVEIGSQLSGQVADVLVDVNHSVSRGQVLAILDDTSLAARVRQARADVAIADAGVRNHAAAIDKARADLLITRHMQAVLKGRLTSAVADHDEAKSNYLRRKKLADRKTISRSELGTADTARRAEAGRVAAARAGLLAEDSRIAAAEATLRMAEAGLDTARALVVQKQAALDQVDHDLARTVITAPIDGTVIARDVDPGQTVAASLESPRLFLIAADLRRMEIQVFVDEADIGRVAVGQPASFSVDAYPTRRFPGRVTKILKAPVVLHNVVTYPVILISANADLALLPGMTAHTRIVVDEAEAALSVPNAALRFSPTPAPGTEAVAVAGAAPSTVWMVDGNGDPIPVEIVLGLTDYAVTEVVSGPLSEGQRVIIGTGVAE